MLTKNKLLSVFTAFLMLCTTASANLLKPSQIEPESREAVLANYLKKTDTVLLVCIYEARFTPEPIGKGALWDKASQCRVVQSLRGKVPVGALLRLHQKSEILPDFGIESMEGEERFTAIPVQGILCYVFLDSHRLKLLENNCYEYFLDTMWLNPLPLSNEEGMGAFRKLIRVKESHIAEESDAAQQQKN